jgi:CubicO group peptidase (beta-lactamase class C family)
LITRRTKLATFVGGFTIGLAGPACARNAHGSAELAGRWGGFLAVGGNGLRLVLEIAEGQPIALISVDQGNARIVATSGTCTASSVEADFETISGKLKLALNPQGALEGEFRQGATRPILFSRLAQGAIPTRPTPAPFSDLQTEVNTERAKTLTPALGCAWARFEDGQTIVQEAASGLQVQGEPTPVAPNLKWHVGSITKSMTATLVARLVEKGKLAWDMKLGDAFAMLAPQMQPAYRQVTLAQLITGRSGMPTNIAPTDMIGHFASADTPTERRKIWARQALSMEPENVAGQGFVYPNNGYVLVGALCESLIGKAYEALMMEEVFAPLGLNSAGFGPPPSGNPQGHRKAILGGRVIPVGIGVEGDNPSGMAPAGRAHMSLPDLAKFGLAHSLGHQGKKNGFLRQETWQYLHTPLVRTGSGNDYAFGWVLRNDGTLWHNGSNTYWLAELAFDPAKSVSACACANLAGTEAAVGRVLAAGLAASPPT